MRIQKTENISTKKNSSLITKNKTSFQMHINPQLEKDAIKFAEKADSSYLEFTKKRFKILKNAVSDNFTLSLNKHENIHNNKPSSMTLSLELHQSNTIGKPGGDELVGEPLIKKTLNTIPTEKEIRKEIWDMIIKLQPEDIKKIALKKS